ncbi:MarR family transcriptional regulator [Sphingomonas sp. A2-49]|uniref:MarR family winged helix-turn-helix transcriptional regulator n=1 Tax=Sphingomonas sp. A2-49 TaxID=1391375 RepID=UPI0021D10764|nr:MarR family transcriptional regulator [Sphingomonas sp. A2-49]MCU6455352.1 MarR family transcriptional regulator [Sphingomonas sp. A2-49]
MSFYSDSNFSPENSIGYLVRRSEQLGTAALEPLFAAHDITKTQWSALVALHFNRASTCAEIARDLGHDKGATTRLVDTLEERGWITRARGEDDRRLVKLALTPSGEAIAATVRDEVIGIWNGWLGSWNEKDIVDLTRLLRRLRDTLQDGVAA